MDFQNLTFGNSLLVSAFSILIVFLVLLCISYLVDGTAFFANRKKRGKELLASGDAAQDNSSEDAESQNEVDMKTAAIIMAAITAYSQSDTRFVIRKIERREATLSDWEAAGIRDTLRRPS